MSSSTRGVATSLGTLEKSGNLKMVEETWGENRNLGKNPGKVDVFFSSRNIWTYPASMNAKILFVDSLQVLLVERSFVCGIYFNAEKFAWRSRGGIFFPCGKWQCC